MYGLPGGVGTQCNKFLLDQILYGTVLSLIEKAVLPCVKLYWSLINCSLPQIFLKIYYDIEKVLLS